MASILCLHTTFPNKMAVKPFSVLNKALKMLVPFELPSGLNKEDIEQKSVISKDPDDKSRKGPPFVFVHGSHHTAWCWAEQWLPLFSASGFDCQAVSLLEMETPYPELAVAVLVCSAPPLRNGGLVWRNLFTKPITAFMVTRSLVAEAFQTDPSLCKETLFSSTPTLSGINEGKFKNTIVRFEEAKRITSSSFSAKIFH